MLEDKYQAMQFCSCQINLRNWALDAQKLRTARLRGLGFPTFNGQIGGGATNLSCVFLKSTGKSQTVTVHDFQGPYSTRHGPSKTKNVLIRRHFCWYLFLLPGKNQLDCWSSTPEVPTIFCQLNRCFSTKFFSACPGSQIENFGGPDGRC